MTREASDAVEELYSRTSAQYDAAVERDFHAKARALLFEKEKLCHDLGRFAFVNFAQEAYRPVLQKRLQQSKVIVRPGKPGAPFTIGVAPRQVPTFRMNLKYVNYRLMSVGTMGG